MYTQYILIDLYIHFLCLFWIDDWSDKRIQIQKTKSKEKQKPLSIVRTVRDTLMSDMLDFRCVMKNLHIFYSKKNCKRPGEAPFQDWLTELGICMFVRMLYKMCERETSSEAGRVPWHHSICVKNREQVDAHCDDHVDWILWWAYESDFVYPHPIFPLSLFLFLCECCFLLWIHI